MYCNSHYDKLKNGKGKMVRALLDSGCSKRVYSKEKEKSVTS